MSQLLHVEPGYASAKLDQVVLIAYTRKFEDADLDRLVGYYRAFPGKFAVFSASADSVPVAASPEARDAITKLYAEYGSRTLAAGHVMLGSSLRASVVRSMLTIASMLSWSKVPQRTFSDLDEGAAWMAAVLDQPELGPRLRDAIDELFRRASECRDAVA